MSPMSLMQESDGRENVMEIPGKANLTGGEPIISDAYTINGKPGYLYPCSKKGTYKMMAEKGKRYLLQIISAIMDENLFFDIVKHKLTLVGKDGFYMKPFTTDYLMITPVPWSIHGCFIGSKPISWKLFQPRHTNSSCSPLPILPPYNSTQAATNFTKQFRSLASKSHPAKVPFEVDTHLLYTISVNLLNCSTEKPFTGPFGKRFASSAYYYGISDVFEEDFPRKPPHKINYSGDNLPENHLKASFGTQFHC
ncbi:hypothetical protein CRYUN_Cryun04dG0080900 [Craigia yunnanensis]